MSKILLIVLPALLLSSCSTKLHVTYTSDPTGALLYQGERQMGYCPLTLIYEVSPRDRRVGRKVLKGTRVQWASGAAAEIESLTSELARGEYQSFNFVRPRGQEGRELDVSFAIEVDKMKMAEREQRARQNINLLQIQAQQNANMSQIFNNIANSYKRAAPVKVKANCSSHIIGSTIYTDCY